MDQLLRQHPDIAMAEPKEPDLFHDPGRHRFDGSSPWEHRVSERICGDASATYLGSADVADRIHQLCDDPRFVVCLREPIARTVSHYEFRSQRGLETRGFQKVLDAGWKADVMNFSRYGTQIRPWIELFGREVFLFIHLSEIALYPGRTMARVHSFLGVEQLAVTSVTENATRLRGSRHVARLVRSVQPIAHRAPQKLKPVMRAAAGRLYRVGKTSGRYVPSREQIKHMIELFEPEVGEFEQAVGIDLSHWRSRWMELEAEPGFLFRRGDPPAK